MKPILNLWMHGMPIWPRTCLYLYNVIFTYYDRVLLYPWTCIPTTDISIGLNNLWRSVSFHCFPRLKSATKLMRCFEAWGIDFSTNQVSHDTQIQVPSNLKHIRHKFYILKKLGAFGNRFLNISLSDVRSTIFFHNVVGLFFQIWRPRMTKLQFL